jgi:hypothetical protein
MDHEVFISYATPDRHIAEAICSTLEQSEVKCWIAPRDIDPGKGFAGAISRAISTSKILIFVYSSSANLSEHMQRELGLADKHRVPIWTFRVEDVPLSEELEYYLSKLQWIDAFATPPERHLPELAEKVRKALGKGGLRPPPPPPPPDIVPPPTVVPPKPGGDASNGQPSTLPDIVQATGLKFLKVDPKTIAVPFKGDRVEQVVVQARLIGDSLALFSVNLPEPGFFGKEAALHALLRTTFLGNYVKAVAVSPSGYALAAELPMTILTPSVAEGTIRGLVQLCDVTRGDMADWPGWQKRLQQCGQSQAQYITITAEAAEQAMLDQASGAGYPMSKKQGTWLLELPIGGQTLKVTVRAFRQVVSCIAYLGGAKPTGDKKAYMTRLLELNRAANVAKVGLDKDDDAALMYEVPCVFPGLISMMQEQFSLLLIGVIALHAGNN